MSSCRMKSGDRMMAVIFALLLLAAAAFFTRGRFAERPGQKVVTIMINGEAAGILRIDENAEPSEQTYHSGGGFNIVETAGARVRVVSADCPDKRCVGQGWISREGGTVVCLPHRFLIRIEGRGEAGEPDGVTY